MSLLCRPQAASGPSASTEGEDSAWAHLLLQSLPLLLQSRPQAVLGPLALREVQPRTLQGARLTVGRSPQAVLGPLIKGQQMPLLPLPAVPWSARPLQAAVGRPACWSEGLSPVGKGRGRCVPMDVAKRARW